MTEYRAAKADTAATRSSVGFWLDRTCTEHASRGVIDLNETVKGIALIVAALLGANVGSFLNVCIYRIPREGLTVSRPSRSFCPSCGSWIPWFDNIPLVSWLRLGGCCRFCRAPISSRYFIVEALTATLFVLVAQRYLGGSEPQWLAFIAVVVLVSALVAASMIDLELRILPDEITVRGMAMAPFVALAVPDLHVRPVDDSISWLLHRAAPFVERASNLLPEVMRSTAAGVLLAGVSGAAAFSAGLYGYALYWRCVHRGQPKHLRDGYLSGVLAAAFAGVFACVLVWPQYLLSPRVYSYTAATAGMLTGSTLIFLVGVVGSAVFRKPAMGFGDVKLMGLLGAFTGWLGVLVGFFIACFIGAIVGVFLLIRYRSRYLPFGPFLAAGALAMLLCPEAFRSLFVWYRSLFELAGR